MRLLSYIFIVFFIITFLPSCGSSKIKNPGTAAEAESMLAKKRAQETKDAKKHQEEAYKAHHDRQSTAYKASIKKNKKDHLKKAKLQKKQANKMKRKRR